MLKCYRNPTYYLFLGEKYNFYVKDGINMFKGIRYLLSFFWNNQRRYIYYKIVQQILIAIVPLADTVIPKYIIDELTEDRRMEIVVLWIGVLLAVNLIGGCCVSFFGKASYIEVCKAFTKFQTNLADQLSRCDFERLENPEFLDSKEKASKFLYADGRGFAGVLENVFDIFGKLITFAGIVAIISTLNVFVVIGFIVIILLNTYFESKVRKRVVEWEMEKAPIERRTSYFIDLIGNFAFGKEIRIYGIRKWIVDKINYHLNESAEFYFKQSRLSKRTDYLSHLMNFILKGITYIYLAFKVLVNAIGIGDFTMYVSALMSFSGAMNGLMYSFLNIRQFGGYYDALKDYMNVPQKMYEGKRSSVPKGPYEIRFEDVSFKYAGQDNYALKNISLTLKNGERLSVVGENGAGKTTFVKLLCRLYDPTEGKITLNGTDIRDIDYDEYLKIICSVFQDYKLLAFSLKENVAFKNADGESDDKIISILDRAGFGDKLKKLKSGVGTNVYRIFSDDGFEPSGGEGQRIALARAMYKDAPIMILDEPTAALDPRAEYEIYRKFSEMTEGKTTIFISHRLSSSKFCDHVALFKDGRISEYGTHDELIEKNGDYKNLFEMQAKFYR